MDLVNHLQESTIYPQEAGRLSVDKDRSKKVMEFLMDGNPINGRHVEKDSCLLL